MGLAMRVHKKHVIEYSDARCNGMKDVFYDLCKTYMGVNIYADDDGDGLEWEILRTSLQELHDNLTNGEITDEDLSKIIKKFPFEIGEMSVDDFREHFITTIKYMLKTADPNNEYVYVSWF